MSDVPVLDARGYRRSKATLPGFHVGRNQLFGWFCTSLVRDSSIFRDRRFLAHYDRDQFYSCHNYIS